MIGKHELNAHREGNEVNVMLVFGCRCMQIEFIEKYCAYGDMPATYAKLFPKTSMFTKLKRAPIDGTNTGERVAGDSYEPTIGLGTHADTAEERAALRTTLLAELGQLTGDTIRNGSAERVRRINELLNELHYRDTREELGYAEPHEVEGFGD